ncbi:unnamed protein product [Amoebophrya sp. A25]|nr:unnamed protein product [Amoebophrya sp. A25]|eukprot:GSA25T00023410001.1
MMMVGCVGGPKLSTECMHPRVCFALPIHGAMSVGLTLFNKEIMRNCAFPWTVLVLQNVVVLLLQLPYFYFKAVARRGLQEKGGAVRDSFVSKLFGWHASEQGPELSDLMRLRWISHASIAACGLLLVACHVLSLRALQIVNIPLFVLIRNFGPLLTAALELVAYRHWITWQKLVALCTICLGAVIFVSAEDAGRRVSMDGAPLALSVTCLVCLCNVAEKVMLEHVRRHDHVTPVEARCLCGCWSLVASVPFLVIGEGTAAIFLTVAAFAKLLLLTGAMAFLYGNFDFILLSHLRATSLKVANMGYKMLTGTVSVAVFADFVPPLSWVGFVLSFLGLACYSLDLDLGACDGLQVSSCRRKRSGWAVALLMLLRFLACHEAGRPISARQVFHQTEAQKGPRERAQGTKVTGPVLSAYSSASSSLPTTRTREFSASSNMASTDLGGKNASELAEAIAPVSAILPGKFKWLFVDAFVSGGRAHLVCFPYGRGSGDCENFTISVGALDAQEPVRMRTTLEQWTRWEPVSIVSTEKLGERLLSLKTLRLRVDKDTQATAAGGPRQLLSRNVQVPTGPLLKGQYGLVLVTVVYTGLPQLGSWLRYHIQAGVEHLVLYVIRWDAIKSKVLTAIGAGLLRYVTFVRWDFPWRLVNLSTKQLLPKGEFAQSLAINDATYRLKGVAEYLAVCDPDEFFFSPSGNMTLGSIIRQRFRSNNEKVRVGAIVFRSWWTDFPTLNSSEFPLTQSGIAKASRIGAPVARGRTKYISRVEDVLINGVHKPWKLRTGSREDVVPVSVAYVAHFLRAGQTNRKTIPTSLTITAAHSGPIETSVMSLWNATATEL